MNQGQTIMYLGLQTLSSDRAFSNKSYARAIRSPDAPDELAAILQTDFAMVS